MQWDDTASAGFTTGTPWLAVNPDHVDVNAAAARRDPRSVFAHYRALIALRHSDECVVDGRFELLLPDHEQLWVFTRTLGDERLLVLANCSSDAVTVNPSDVPDVVGAVVLLTTHDGRTGLDLAPWESRVLRLA
jgi:oligo-1,6-glucosidase